MARAKKTVQPPQSSEDVELAKQTITEAFGDTVERQRTELAKAEEEVLRLQRKVAIAEDRRAAWVDRGEIDEDRALDARMFSGQDMRELARRVTSPAVRLDPDEVDAARRKRDVVERYLTDRNLLPAALVDPNWKPSR